MRIGALIAGLVVLAAAGCGGGGGEPSDQSLRDRILPAAQVNDNFKFRRAYIFTNPIDASIQGLQFSENTQPSELVNAIDDAGFVKGAGQEVQAGDIHGPIIGIDAWQFDSDSGAEKARDRVQAEYHKQPCYSICSQKESELDVPDIPGARGQASEPDPARPPETGPGFEAYAVEFTIGPYLYVIAGGGDPGANIKDAVLDAAQKQYALVKDL